MAIGKRIFTVFGAPLTSIGLGSLPLTVPVVGGILAWVAHRSDPQRSWGDCAARAAVQTPVVLELEWCHNLAHTAAASWVGQPLDEMCILFGTPRLIYYNINDTSVTPRQHILRALGGPVFNGLALLVSLFLRRRSKPGTLARAGLDAAVATNAFIGGVGLLPIPGIDGGPILKWSLVEGGRSPAESDRVVRQVNGVLGTGLAAATAAAASQRRWWLAALFGLFSVSALGYALGWLKEQ